jgi:hypothetical protein
VLDCRLPVPLLAVTEIGATRRRRAKKRVFLFFSFSFFFYQNLLQDTQNLLQDIMKVTYVKRHLLLQKKTL